MYVNCHQTVVSIISLLIIAGAFSGCLNSPDKSGASDRESKSANLEKISFDGGLKLNPASYQALPLLSSLIVNRRINFDINESGSIFDDISLFSSRIAISFWNCSNDLFVVDSYKNLLLVSSLAKMLNAPILVYGNGTEEAIATIKPQKIFSVGNVPISATKLSPEDIIERQIEIAKNSHTELDYLVLVNSNDSASKIPGLSSFGALLACYHNGLIFEVTNETYPKGAITDTNASGLLGKIKLFYKSLEEKNVKLKHVCIVGGADAIPQIANETFREKPPMYCEAYSDNYWGDVDGNAVFPEFGVGRFLAANLIDAWSLFARYFNYKQYLESDVLDSLSWKNSALVFFGNDLAMLAPSFERGTVDFMKANFTTYQLVDLSSGTDAEKQIIATFMERSNFIRLLNHGTVEGGIRDMDFARMKLGPSIMFAESCSAGKIDGNVSINSSAVYQSIRSGLATYIGATGISGSGYAIPTGPIAFHEIGSDPLATAFFKRLCEQNMSIGTALKEAKIHFIEEAGFYPINPYMGYSDMFEAYQYTLYGDPAFNPYEPCNEGSA